MLLFLSFKFYPVVLVPHLQYVEGLSFPQPCCPLFSSQRSWEHKGPCPGPRIPWVLRERWGMLMPLGR